MQEKFFVLPNGINVCYKYVPYTKSVHCGFIIDTGGRDDGDYAGISHFIEHMIFKGTQKRKTFHILQYLESVGGDVNAYTTKEKTCVYAAISSAYFGRAVNLLTDIVFDSVFPEKEIQKECQVILEEIDMYRDAPDEAIFEDFDEMIFPNHVLGIPILGTKESIPKINKSILIDFYKKKYSNNNIVFSVVGNVSEKELMKEINKNLSILPSYSQSFTRNYPEKFTPSGIKEIKTHTQQAHELIGGRAMGLHDKSYHAFVLLQNILGGPAMNARLNLNIREKYGLTYNINSFYSPFTDSGIWGVYYACDPAVLNRVRSKVIKELGALKEPLGKMQFRQAQQQLCGQLTLGHENLSSQMLGMGKEILDYKTLIPFDSYLKEIEKLTAMDLAEIAREYFDENQLSRIAYVPED
ncbi:MAG: insulinase family protein [Bacteroidia bacterium]|nr:insulinase family protein [Bacteroidia bacterium]